MKNLITGVALFAFCFLFACTSKTNINTQVADSAATIVERNKQTAWRSKQAFMNKDVEGVFKYCAPGFTDCDGGDATPESNIDSIKAGMKMFLTAFPDFKGEDITLYGHADTVIMLGTWSGTFKAALGSMKPTGKAFKMPDADIYTFNKEGKITSYKSIQSNAGYFSQLVAH